MPNDDYPIYLATHACSPKPVELCEHKGIGHPDTICDGVAEAVSQALCRAYVAAYGAIQHYNVDKALLLGGRSEPRFGGGRILVSPRLILGGCATDVAGEETADIVCAAARDYLRSVLHCAVELFSIESAVRAGASNLRRVLARGAASALANDTSFGAAYAPLSEVNRVTLRLAELLRSSQFRATFPAAGDDFKIMGIRTNEALAFTIALAFVDQHVTSIEHYASLKQAITTFLSEELDVTSTLRLNTLDVPDAHAVSDVYLTVSGLSAEHGDDGEVGRGNRVNGLITPDRCMSLEAAAGKNAVAHVGKIYNVLAQEIAQDLVVRFPEIKDVSVQMLSSIGTPVHQPALVYITIESGWTNAPVLSIKQIVRQHVDGIGSLMDRLAAGEVRVF